MLSKAPPPESINPPKPGNIRKVDTYERESYLGMMLIRESYEVTPAPDRARVLGTERFLVAGARYKIRVKIAEGMPDQDKVLPLPPFEIEADSLEEAFDRYPDAVMKATDDRIDEINAAEKGAEEERKAELAKLGQQVKVAPASALAGLGKGPKRRFKPGRRP